MRIVNAIVERASDRTFSIYMDPDATGYLITGTGDTPEAAVDDFKNAYAEMKEFYEKSGKPFEECVFEFIYDTASFVPEQ